MTVYYCMVYFCEIEKVNAKQGKDPGGNLHPCFTREKGYHNSCSALIELPDFVNLGSIVEKSADLEEIVHG